MERYCYTLAIRQRACQNGITRRIDNVYSNCTPSLVIPLSFGYELTFIVGNPNSATVQISNPDQIPNLIFNIPSGGYKIFDLPVPNGTLRVFVGATTIECGETTICCTCNN